jgi:phosphatidylethanolamine/phosphatidyl-N-methylethanolamine N-methyltransferase
MAAVDEADPILRSRDAAGDASGRVSVLERLHFLVQFALHPRVTGAIAPSSRQLAEAIVNDMGLESAADVVELGAGTGVFTSVIAERLSASARFMAMEINPRLAASLRRAFAAELRVVCGSAEEICRHLDDDAGGGVDAMISSLPWVSFPGELQESILQEIHKALRPGARFATFAYAHAAWLPSGRKFRRRLDRVFARTEITPIVWRNLPPAFIYRCQK